MKRFALASLALAALPAAAVAQNNGALCKDAAMPFNAAAGNRLQGPALQQAVSGKRLTYVRESLRTSGVWVSNTRELRADGSFAYVCEFSRNPSGPRAGDPAGTARRSSSLSPRFTTISPPATVTL